jgi:hypothetical protein
MRRRSILFVSLAASLILGVTPTAEALQIRWQKEAGKKLTDVARGPDGSLYVAGSDTRSITTAATLRKYSPSGDLRWVRHWLPSVQDSTGGNGVAVGDDGTVYILGSVHGTCEGGGWFIRAYTPGGDLRWRYVTPGWQCSIAEVATDIAVRGDLVVVSGYSHGCCGDPFHDGWVQAFTRDLDRRWRANVEPPSPTPASWFDTATGVGIGSHGGVFASGWAAKADIPEEASPTPGTPILTRFTEHGARVWSKRAPVAMPTMFQPTALAVGPGGVAVAAGVEGRGVAWGLDPTTGWLAKYSTDGGLLWERTWGGGRTDASTASGVAFGEGGRIWVLGTRRDPGDRGTDVVVRWYQPGGALYDRLRMDPARRYVWSGGIASVGFGAAATGWDGNRFQADGGRLWRITG